MNTVRIWDLPVRLFHWLFAASCTVAWLSGDDPRYTDLHLYSGYLAVGLVIFRLVWGFVGGRYARFKQFVHGPVVVYSHLRRIFDSSQRHGPGHNPAGGWAILVMLGMVLLLAATGLVVLGSEEGFGPLAGWFDIGLGVTVHQWHEGLAWILLLVVLLHLAGVLLESRLQRQNLPHSMISGQKAADRDMAERHNATVSGGMVLLAFVTFSAVWFYPYLVADDEQPYLPFVDVQLTHDSAWQDSCGECHLAYHPSLLPARSWQRIFEEQHEHFGEDLFLTPVSVAALLEYAKKNSAEQVSREASWRTLQSLAADARPLRITETSYWKTTHQDLAVETWEHPSVNGSFNCDACHRDARLGGFVNGAMYLPNSVTRFGGRGWAKGLSVVKSTVTEKQ